MSISPTVFFDIGGVLLTDGWDYRQRQEIYNKFSLNPIVIENKHKLIEKDFNEGRICLDDYLLQTVFDAPQVFTKEQYYSSICELSQPIPEMLLFAKKLKEKAPLYSLNNESKELHQYRVETYRLNDLFSGYFCSGFMGLSKPCETIFRIALDTLSLRPSEVIFVDDRSKNIQVAKEIGFITVHHRDVEATSKELQALLS